MLSYFASVSWGGVKHSYDSPVSNFARVRGRNAFAFASALFLSKRSHMPYLICIYISQNGILSCEPAPHPCSLHLPYRICCTAA